MAALRSRNSRAEGVTEHWYFHHLYVKSPNPPKAVMKRKVTQQQQSSIAGFRVQAKITFLTTWAETELEHTGCGLSLPRKAQAKNPQIKTLLILHSMSQLQGRI